MKRILVGFSFLAASTAFAEPVLATQQPSVHFERMNVVDAIEAVYGDILKDSYSIDSDLLKSEKMLSFHVVGSRDPDQLHKFMETYLRGIGVAIQKRADGLYFLPLSKVEKEPGQSLVYKMRARSMRYFADLLPAVFPKLKFSFHRGVQSDNSPPAEGEAGQGDSRSSRPVDNGTSAYSQIDKESDVFVAVGDPADLKRLSSLLDELDVPEAQAVVHAYLYEVNADNTKEHGFSAALTIFNRLGFSVGAAPQNSGASAFTIKGGDLQLALSSLNGNSNYKLISSPSLRVRDGGKGRFSVGSDVPVLGSVQQDRNGNPVQSVDYKPSGVILDVSPTIHQDTVSLHIGQQESSFVKTTSGVDNSPTLLKREMQTDLVVKPGDVILLGSLNESKESASDNGDSWLPSLFHGTLSEKSQNDVFLVMSVDVVR